MKRIPTVPLLALLAVLSGCAADRPLADGKRVRAIMMSQTVPPTTPAGVGTDASSAVAAHANYQKSFVTPTPQDDKRTFSNNR